MEMTEKKKLPFVSAMLVIINVIVFLICTFTGDLLYNKGILAVSPVLWAGEYDRIIWAMFLHSDVQHIFNNMVIAWFLGAMIEKEIGHLSYGIVYFLSGIGGNILSLMVKVMTSEMAGTIGASGAIFGLDGILLALILFSSKQTLGVTPGKVLLMIGLSLYSGYTGGNIDNAAHIGGLVTGFLSGIVICIFDRIKAAVRQRM